MNVFVQVQETYPGEYIHKGLIVYTHFDVSTRSLRTARVIDHAIHRVLIVYISFQVTMNNSRIDLVPGLAACMHPDGH